MPELDWDGRFVETRHGLASFAPLAVAGSITHVSWSVIRPDGEVSSRKFWIHDSQTPEQVNEICFRVLETLLERIDRGAD